MNRRAITLLEVLIALGLGITLLSSVAGFTWTLRSARREIMATASARRTLSLVFDRLEQDLLTAVASTSDGRAGIAGEGRAITVMARGVTPRWSGDQRDLVGDLHLLELSFDPEDGAITMVREPFPARAGVADEGAAPLPGRVRELAFRYFDGRRWHSSWDSLEEGGLPVAVEIAAWFGQPLGSESGVNPPRVFDGPAARSPVASSFPDDSTSIPDRRRVIHVLDSASPDADDDAEGRTP